MAKFADYYYAKVRGHATINGVSYPMQWFSATYGIDNIPIARFGVPIGRNADLSGLDSGTVGVLSQLQPFTPVELRLSITPQSGRGAPPGKSQGYPTGEFSLFKGFIRTPGSDKIMEGATATLTFDCFGAPAGLGGSTQMATGYASDKIDNFNTAIIVQTHDGQISLTHIDAILKGRGTALTFIGDTIEQIFSGLIEATSVWTGAQNNNAADALSRLHLNEPGPALNANPLTLHQAFGNSQQRLAVSLASFFVSRIWDRWRVSPLYPGADLWEVIMALRTGLGFHFIPAVDEDALAPLTLNLGGSVSGKGYIEPSEYWQIRFTPQEVDKSFYAYTTQAALFGTALTNSLFQGRMPAAQRLGFAEISALTGPAQKTPGKMLLIDALNEAPYVLCPGAAGFDAGLGGQPAYDASGGIGKPPPLDQGNLANTYYASGLGNDYAATRLHDELFKHRMCQITGRFRMDLSPGTLVKIRTPSDKFATGAPDVYYGHIGQVDLFGGDQGGGGNLGTQYTIINIRTQAEQDTCTINQHPLYQDRWEGGSLLAGL